MTMRNTCRASEAVEMKKTTYTDRMDRTARRERRRADRFARADRRARELENMGLSPKAARALAGF